MSSELYKPVIGFSIGDLNGIGPEIIIKALQEQSIMAQCTPVIFANGKSLNFYRKTIAESNFNFFQARDFDKLSDKQPNLITCWEEEISITPGVLNETGGQYALKSLVAATQALKAGQLDALVTAPIHKSNVQSDDFRYSGHTPFLKAQFEAKDVCMFMVAPNLRVGLLTEHVAVKDVHLHVTRENILSKLAILHKSLKEDFGINKPRIAVLGLNPHAGDEGLIGQEDQTIIKPTVDEARQKMLVFGPYPADAFFARGHYQQFDVVLAIYHDQGLIPFKTLAADEGTNFTAGLPVVRTSPDHGTAFDIAGKDAASHQSLLTATFEAIDIVRRRRNHGEAHANPLKKLSGKYTNKGRDDRNEE